jgi:hypothetical protein
MRKIRYDAFVKRLELPSGFEAPTRLAYEDVVAVALTRAQLQDDVGHSRGLRERVLRQGVRRVAALGGDGVPLQPPVLLQRRNPGTLERQGVCHRSAPITRRAITLLWLCDTTMSLLDAVTTRSTPSRRRRMVSGGPGTTANGSRLPDRRSMLTSR